MSEESRKPFQSGREIYEHFIPNYSSELSTSDSPLPIEGQVSHSQRALETFVAHVEELKKSIASGHT